MEHLTRNDNSMAYRILEHEAVKDAIRRIAEDLVSKVSSQVDDDALSADRRVHRVRTTCKRMRALLRMTRPALRESTYRRENARYRDLARLAGSARDARVALDTFDALVGDEPDELARAAGLRARLDEHLRAVGAPSDPFVALTEIRPALAEAWTALRDLKLRGKGFELIGPGYIRTYQLGLKAQERAYERPSAELFHEWRKQAKYGLYQTQLLRDVWPKVMRERRRAFAELGEDLGTEHDLYVLRGELRELGGGDQLEDLLRDLRHQREQLRRRCLRQGDRLYVESPRAHLRRIRGLWTAWRRPS
jgi:CHAD domain-containing protein